MRTLRRTTLSAIPAVTLALALLVAGCAPYDPELSTAPTTETSAPETADPVSTEAWAAEAVTWTQALDTLPGELGGSAWSYFWAPDIEFDYRSMWPSATVLVGDDAFSFMRRLLPPRAQAVTPDTTPFISTDRVVSLLWLDWGPSGMDTASITRTPGHIVDLLGPVGPDGAERMVSAFATDSWRERRVSRVEPDEADQFATRWIAVWSGLGSGATSLYATDAELVDSIAGVTARGRPGIFALAEAPLAASWRVARLADGTAMVYALSNPAGSLDGVVLVAEGTNGAGCAQRLAVELTVSDGLVTREERIWSIDDARRCLAAGDLPDGWWTGRDLEIDEPAVVPEDLVTRTGRVRVNGVRVSVFNGSPWLQEAVYWAFGRFDDAGLDLPSLVEVTFTSYEELCDDAVGRGRLRAGNWSLFFCFAEADLCHDDDCTHFALGPKHVLLHELAHVWLRSNLDDEDRAAFTAFVGLEVWRSSDVDWGDQAMEHAAETLAWGLCDQPFNLWRLGSVDREQAQARYEFLTGRATGAHDSSG